jgi:hypothetical protein
VSTSKGFEHPTDLKIPEVTIDASLSMGTPLTILRTTPVKPRKIHEKM